MKSEIEQRTNFNIIRYAQCWEDAEILTKALDIKPTDKILSVASAGDNAFAMLVHNPKKILAVDLSFEQIACCELRKACYKYLSYDEFIFFSGVKDNKIQPDRIFIYDIIKNQLPLEIKSFWDANLKNIEKGFMTIGKFENYFNIFRTKVIPLIHTRKIINELLQEKTLEEQKEFYNNVWNTKRWRGMFNIFFSNKVMGKLGRDEEFYKYVQNKNSETIFLRAEHALTNIKNHENPYLNFILNGKYNEYLPMALQKENFEIIKNNLDKIEFKQMSIEDAINEDNFTCYNLSDIFEYMSQSTMDDIYLNILKQSPSGSKIAYWNMLVDRKCIYTDKVKYDRNYCQELLKEDKAFFYSDFVLEKII